MLTTHLHLAPRLRMSVVTRLFALRYFMVWTRITFFHCTVKEGCHVRASHSTERYIPFSCVVRNSLSVAENSALDKGRGLWSTCVWF